MLAARTARSGGRPARQGQHGLHWDDVRGLVRKQAKHRLPKQFHTARLHHADAAIAVFERTRELADLMRATHAPILAHRHATMKDE